MYYRPPQASLESLPNELLHDIFSYLTISRGTPKKYSAVYALSKVNKWLRSFSLPLLFRDIYIRSLLRFRSAIVYFSTLGKENATYVQCVSAHFHFSVDLTSSSRSIRFLQLWRHSPNHYVPMILFGPLARAQHPIFPNLRSFECFNDLNYQNSRRWTIDIPNKGLRQLRMPYPCSRLFPPVEHFPELESLQLILSPRYTHDPKSYIYRCICPNCNTPYTSLSQCRHTSMSRLSVHQTDLAQWPSSIWKSLEFPNLRVLNLQGLDKSCVHPTYLFVQRHSTLLEVSLDFKSPKLRLEGLIKLIEGTGTWEIPEDFEPTEPELFLSDSGDIPDASQLIYLEPDYLGFLDDIPDTRVIFSRFAFIREPLTSDAKEWRSEKASALPRYKTIAIAFQIPDQREFALGGDIGPLRLSNIDDFLTLSRYFPELRELRVESKTMCSRESDFMSWMVSSILNL